MKIRDDFWRWIEKDVNGCWNWTRAKTSSGYGHFGLNGKTILAHRFAWELTHGSFDNSLCVLHKCDNRRCVNPDHLWLGTKSENTLDASRKGRRYIIPKSVMRRGERHGLAKLTDDQAKEIYQRYDGRRGSITRFAEEFGVCIQTISNIVHNKGWQSVTGGCDGSS